MLQFLNYSKSYNHKLIIQAPDLHLNHDIYWLKGENGSGKTTLIKSIAGLIPFDGQISICDKDIKKERTDYRLLVNYAEAEPVYPVFLTGDDLIKFYVSTKKADELQVNELKDALGIGSFSGNKIGTYSSGMAKKLSLVLAFIGNPKLILLDEPLITLDQQSVINFQQILEGYFKKGTMLLITSHQEITFGNQFSRRLAIKDSTLTLV